MINIKREAFLNNNSKRVLFILFAFLMLYLISYLINPYAIFWRSYSSRSWLSLATEWFLSFVFCALISESSIFINTRLNNYMPWTEKPVIRLFVQTCLHIISALAIILVQFTISYFIMDGPEQSCVEEDIVGFWQWIIISVFIALMISGINTLNYMITNWRMASLEAAEHKLNAAEHKQAAIEAELQALKLQIDPHFVFNNLSVLSELILEDQQLGYEYAESFSKVYRYLLISSKKDITTLEQELKFLNAYIFLIENRVGAGVIFNIDIDSAYTCLSMPPLTLQLLIENALKHNKTIKTNPLTIDLFIDENEDLVISNTRLPLDKKAQSSGIGLANIISRYKLLSDKMPTITESETSFTVSVPLIKL